MALSKSIQALRPFNSCKHVNVMRVYAFLSPPWFRRFLLTQNCHVLSSRFQGPRSPWDKPS